MYAIRSYYEGDALLLVVVARCRLDDEAQHVETAEEDLSACGALLDVALGFEVS